MIWWTRYLSLVYLLLVFFAKNVVNNSGEKIVKKWEEHDIKKNNLKIVYQIPILSEFNLRFHYFGFETVIFVMNNFRESFFFKSHLFSHFSLFSLFLHFGKLKFLLKSKNYCIKTHFWNTTFVPPFGALCTGESEK